MNERIKELYSQVGLDFENFQRVTVKKGDMEKFAELIVQKCADIGERYADGNYEVRNQILIHFGLEEPEE
jgi:hypothetical protein